MFTRWRHTPEAELSAPEIADLKSLCHSVAARLQSAGRRTPALAQEPRVWPANIRHRLEFLRLYDEILAAQQNGGESLNDHKALTWKFLKKMGYAPTSDIFERLADADILEIFDTEGNQLFRNLNYFDVVSFSVEDLVSLNWKRDYKRDRKLTLSLIELNCRLVMGHFPTTYDCGKIPIHLLREQLGERLLVELQLKWISPIRRNGKCAGIIVISRARRVN